MQFTAAQIAMLVQGTVEGDPGICVHSFGKIEDAREGELSFLNNPKYEEFIYTTKASIVLINEGLQLKNPVPVTLIRVADAYTALAVVLGTYQKYQQEKITGIQEPSCIAPSATLGEQVFIGAFCYIGEHVQIGKNTKIFPGAYIGNHVTIGENCIIDPGVKIYRDCKLGNHITILAGTVIGGDGFGYAPQKEGSYLKIPQMGNVVIEDFVDIGANVTIDRATLGSTIIRTGTKLDNLIQVAHNVEIGAHTIIAAQAGISGSTKIGNRVLIGGQAGIVGHIQIGDGSKVNAQSGVSKSLEAGKAVTGSPAFEYTAALRSQALSKHLPDLEKRVKELEAQVKQLLKEKIS